MAEFITLKKEVKCNKCKNQIESLCNVIKMSSGYRCENCYNEAERKKNECRCNICSKTIKKDSESTIKIGTVYRCKDCHNKMQRKKTECKCDKCSKIMKKDSEDTIKNRSTYRCSDCDKKAKIERQEWENLYETIRENFFGGGVLPTNLVGGLQELRKMGYSYDELLDSLKHDLDMLMHSFYAKDFINAMQGGMYVLAGIKNNISSVSDKKQEMEEKNSVAEEYFKNVKETEKPQVKKAKVEKKIDYDFLD